MGGGWFFFCDYWGGCFFGREEGGRKEGKELGVFWEGGGGGVVVFGHSPAEAFTDFPTLRHLGATVVWRSPTRIQNASASS